MGDQTPNKSLQTTGDLWQLQVLIVSLKQIEN